MALQNVVDTVNARKGRSTPSSNNDTDNSSRATHARTPFEMDCVTWRKKKKKIVFRCNPSDYNISFPSRGSTQNVKSGKVFYWWKNSIKNSHFDLPDITFTFQTGNIVPILGEGDAMYVPSGLNNFYEFMSLIDEDKMLADGTPNFITIQHHSAAFPNLTLTGFFDPSKGVGIKETAGDSVLTWDHSFFIHDSIPKMNSASFASAFQNKFLSQ